MLSIGQANFRQVSDENILEHLRLRSSLSRDTSVSWKDIMDLEAFRDFFSKDEKQVVEEQSKEMDAERKSHKSFKDQWKENKKAWQHSEKIAPPAGKMHA